MQNRFTVTEGLVLEALLEDVDLAKFKHWVDDWEQPLDDPNNTFWTDLATKIDNLTSTTNY